MIRKDINPSAAAGGLTDNSKQENDVIKTIAYTIAFWLVIAVAFGISQDELIDRQMAKIGAVLALNSEQSAATREIILSKFGKLRKVLDYSSNDMRDMIQKYRSIEEDARKEIGKLLDENQQDLLTSYDHNLLPNGRLIFLNDRLNLTLDQVNAIDDILAKAPAMPDEAEGERPQRGGPPGGFGGGQGGPGRGPGGGGAMMQKLSEQDEQIRAVLTDRQRAEYDRIREEMREQVQPRARKGSGGGWRGGDDW